MVAPRHPNPFVCNAGIPASPLMCTRPDLHGTITANTRAQLNTMTWAQIRAWTKLLIAADWLEATNHRLSFRGFEESWFCSQQTCRKENSEAFAGQHAAHGTSFFVLDEASAIPDVIFDVAEGGMTDGEPMIFAFGNPTRSSGRFYEAVCGKSRHIWNHRSIDSRTSALTNKPLIEEWIDQHRLDSDFVRSGYSAFHPMLRRVSSSTCSA